MQCTECNWYIMVIELSGVLFGLKSYAWFEITSMISDQTCTTRGSITNLLHPFWNCLNAGLFWFKYFIDKFWPFKSELLVKRRMELFSTESRKGKTKLAEAYNRKKMNIIMKSIGTHWRGNWRGKTRVTKKHLIGRSCYEFSRPITEHVYVPENITLRLHKECVC